MKRTRTVYDPEEPFKPYRQRQAQKEGVDNAALPAFVSASAAAIGHLQDVIRRVGSAIIGGAFNGNARGLNALDFQTHRATAAQVAAGENAIAIGSENTAATDNTIAIGHNNSASCANPLHGGVAIGADNTALGEDAVAMGANCIAGSHRTVALGDTANAADDFALAVGTNATAGAAASIAIGTGAHVHALEDDSIAIGQNAETNAAHQTVIGGPTTTETKIRGNITLPTAGATVDGIDLSYLAYEYANHKHAPGDPMQIIHTDITGVSADQHHAAITLGDHANHLLTLTAQALTTPATNANVVYAGPASGAAASADWRSLVTADIAAEMITYAKLQHVSATDKLLGRSTAGAGDVEEITCTAAGRALLDDAAASNQCTTLGLGTGDGPTFDHVHVTTPNNGNLIGSGAVPGGVLRAHYMVIANATDAAHIKCSTVQRWNGDVNAEQNNIGKDNTNTGNWKLEASGSILWLLSGGITGTPLSVLASYPLLNLSGVDICVNSWVSLGCMCYSFTNAATGAAFDLTTLVDTGSIYIQVLYLTSA